MKISTSKNMLKAVLLLATVFTGIKTVSAQLNPYASMYFQNQYLSNPAMAGLDQGLNLNLAIRQQWATLPGSPKAQFISGDYNAGKHVGLGLSVSNDQTGLIRQTRAVATYAYHVILGANNQQLNFGLSAGISTQHINYNEVNGDQGDVQIDRYNNQNRAYPDGDFGVSYTSNNLTVQGALPNLNHLFKTSNTILGVDRSVFITSVSYKFALNVLDGSALEPKLVFRGVDNYKSVLDAGLNLSLKNDLLHLYSMYHSSQSESFGFGANISKALQLMLFYTTENTPLKTYTNGDFEVGLKLHLYKE